MTVLNQKILNKSQPHKRKISHAKNHTELSNAPQAKIVRLPLGGRARRKTVLKRRPIIRLKRVQESGTARIYKALDVMMMESVVAMMLKIAVTPPDALFHLYHAEFALTSIVVSGGIRSFFDNFFPSALRIETT